MSRVRQIKHAREEDVRALAHRLTLIEAVLAQVLETVDEIEIALFGEEVVPEGPEPDATPTETEYPGLAADVDPEQITDFELSHQQVGDINFPPGDELAAAEDELAEQRREAAEARREQRREFGEEAKQVKREAPVHQDEHQPTTNPEQPLDPVERANQIQEVE